MWGVGIEKSELPEGVTLLHGRFGDGTDPHIRAFCGADGGSVRGEAYVVNLDHPDAHSSMVTCPECKEWIHG